MTALKEKVAFVTGGTRGMGRAIVERLAKEGAIVVFTYVNSDEKAQQIEKEISRAGGKAFAIKSNGALKGAVKNAIEQAVELLKIFLPRTN